MRTLTFSIVLGLIGSTGQAGEVLQSYVDHDDGHYFLHMEMRVNAPVARVYAALTDFDNLTKINNNIIESTMLKNDPKLKHIRVVTEGCILFFCKRMVQLQHVIELGQGYVSVRVDPEKSDFTHGHMLWHIRAHDTQQQKQTLVNFSADVAPDFWIPPLIGPWLLKNTFYEETRQTVNGLERLAKQRQQK